MEIKHVLGLINNLTFPEAHLLHGKSCAIVGNSGSLLENYHGDNIDSHDFVIRFNQAEILNYEKFVGTKTNLRILNQHNFAIINGENLEKYLSVFPNFSPDIFADLNETNFLAKFHTNITNANRIHPNLSIQKISKKTDNLIRKITFNEPTCGFIGLAIALSYFKRVTLFGFDFYKTKSTHYFESVAPYNQSANHNFDIEQRITRALHSHGIIQSL